jgi:hypothetical protein
METVSTVELRTPCKKCGDIKRYKSTGACVSCARKRAAKLRQENKGEHVLQQQRYRKRAFIKRATPSWADLDAIKRIEEDAGRLSKQMGVPMHVIHEVPLRGRGVCGLHVECNLKVVSQSWISARSRKYPRPKRLWELQIREAEIEQMKWLDERGLT